MLWRCPRCGYVRRDLALAPARARSLEYGGDPVGDGIRLAITARRLRARLGPRLRGRVLEIGAGDARLAADLAPFVDEVVAVDPHAPAEPPAGSRGFVRCVAAAWEDVDLEPASFDVVIGIHVLEHVADVVATLARVRELLRPGGIAYLVTPNGDTAALRVFGEDWWMLEDPTHLRFVSSRSARLLAARAGFSHVAVRPLRLDSLAVEAATIARRFRVGDDERGVLATRGVLAAAAVALPATLALRTVRPRWCPSIEIVLGAPA